jgi:hypothetical protein
MDSARIPTVDRSPDDCGSGNRLLAQPALGGLDRV